MHIALHLIISVVLLGYVHASSNLTSKEGSILSVLMNKTEDNAQSKNKVDNGSADKEPNPKISKTKKEDPSSGRNSGTDTRPGSSATGDKRDESNPKIAKNSFASMELEGGENSSDPISKVGLLSGHAKELSTHIVRLSENSPSVIRDTTFDIIKKPPSIIKDNGGSDASNLAEKKSALSDLATSAIEGRDSGNMRNELHEMSTSLI